MSTDYSDYDARSRAEVIALISRQAKRIAELEKVAEAARLYRFTRNDPLGGSAVPELEGLDAALDALDQPIDAQAPNTATAAPQPST